MSSKLRAERPNPNIKPPEYMVVTEGFDPPGVARIIQRLEAEKHMRVKGTVKWFNNDKGYGFIAQDNGPDVFVHHSNIEGRGFKSLVEGDRVHFRAEMGDKGWFALEVEKV